MNTYSSDVYTAEMNQQAMMAAIGALSQQLQAWISEGRTARIAGSEPKGEPWLLDRVDEIFQLSPFERRILLAAAAVEIDGGFAGLCAEAQGDSRLNYPTFQLLLSTFSDAHWDALSPNAPLRSWRLISLGSGETLAASRIRIDERILHFLLGVPCESAYLTGVLHLLDEGSVRLPVLQEGAAARIGNLLATYKGRNSPVIQLLGADIATRRAVAVEAAVKAGLRLGRIVLPLLPSSANEVHNAARMLDREAALTGLAFYLPFEEVETGDAARSTALQGLVEMVGTPLLLAAEDPLRFGTRETVLFELQKPTPAEQNVIWQEALGTHAQSFNGTLDKLSSHFHLGAETIHHNCAMALSLAGDSSSDADPATAPNGHALAGTLWKICRLQSRVRLDKLAQRVTADAGWDDLVLPEKEISTLKAIASQMQHRLRVHEQWGFKGSGGRGMGLTCIFAGLSGTGKTTAAEVLAKELDLDLFRVDLSHTISKYIGETSRNLRRVFDAAEEAGAILLFDEADALFGKRSEVRDSHDRYANAEVSYLLQRLELYRGLAVLATNMKQTIDLAFMRRVRFVVQFPFPDAAMREAIWQRVLPEQAPKEGLDFRLLARLSMTGANIRNIALNGAFLAAGAGEPIRMGHLLDAARQEAAKLERPLPDQEIRGWA